MATASSEAPLLSSALPLPHLLRLLPLTLSRSSDAMGTPWWQLHNSRVTTLPHVIVEATQTAGSSRARTPADEGKETSTAQAAPLPSAVPPPSTFSSLPSEILFAILEYVCDEFLDEALMDDESDGSGFVAPYRILCLNRRIRDIGAPIWFRTIYLRWRDAYETKCFFVNLSNHPHIARLARTLNAATDMLKIDDFGGQLLRMTPLLTELVLVDEEPSHGDRALPIDFWAVLKSLRHLVRLVIPLHDCSEERHDDFRLDRDVPTLRTLTISGSRSLATCMPGLSRLSHLAVAPVTFAGASVPWRTLKSLHLTYEESEDQEDHVQFVASLQAAAAVAPLPLAALRITFDDYSEDRADGLKLWNTILHSASALTTVQLDNFTYFREFDKAPLNAHQPSVQVFALTNGYFLGDQPYAPIEAEEFRNDLQAFYDVLEMFPNCATLRTAMCPEDAEPGTDRMQPEAVTESEADFLVSGTAAELAAEEPFFAAFLYALQETDILEYARVLSRKRRVVYRRRNKAQRFVPEAYTS